MDNYKTIIFDLDGTLIHSVPDIHAAINTVLARIGRAPLDLSQTVSFIGNGVETLVARSLTATGGEGADTLGDVLAMFLAEYEADPSSRTKPYPGVIERLQHLRGQGIKLGVCTNKPTAPARQICDALDLTQYFDVVAGAEDRLPKKPDPAPLLAVIEALGGTVARTLYVGDSTVDHATAHNAGVPFAFFTGGYLNGALVDPQPAIIFDDWSETWV